MNNGHLTAVVAGCVFAGLGVGRAWGAIVTNGDFNADTFTSYPGYAGTANGNSTITGWTYTGGVGLNPAGGSPFEPQNFNSAPSTFAFLQANTSATAATLSQTFSNLNVGQSYELSYEQGPRSGYTNQSTLTGSIGAFSASTSNSFSNFSTVAGQFVATSPTMTLTFTNVLAAGSNDGTNDVTSVVVNQLNGPTVVNGNFETGATDFNSDYGYVSGSGNQSGSQNPAQVAGFVGPNGGDFGVNGPSIGAGTAFSGNYTSNKTNVLFIQSSGTTLTQTIYNFTPGTQYKLDFQYDARDPASIGSSSGSDPGIDVSIGGVSYTVSDVVYNGDYYTGEIDFTASSASEILSLEKAAGPNPDGDSTALFDNFSVTIVPEPASLSLFAAGAAALLKRRRRALAN
jgi:hypothetical protein